MGLRQFLNWHFATIVATNVAGPASFISSDYYYFNAWDGYMHRRFDAVVLEQNQELVNSVRLDCCYQAM